MGVQKASEGWVYCNMIVAVKAIHKGEHEVAGNGVNQDVYVQKQKRLMDMLCQGEVYAVGDLSVLLLEGNYVGEPIRVLDGFDGTESKRFWISCLVCTSISGLKFLRAYLINLLPSLILSLCLTNYGTSPGIWA